MQLRNARLCLDCEEVHDEPHCPICASDSFAYMSRWVPVEERRTKRRSASHQQPAVVLPHQPRRGSRGRWVAGGALGIAALAAGRLLLRKPDTSAGSDGTDPTGVTGGTDNTDKPDNAA